ncbi:MAG TPA: hypothetical protein VMI33_02930 [Streptosporangiaceae bacterium]|nr:hypothetical protein [Streptosporangiaceae bacterium]
MRRGARSRADRAGLLAGLVAVLLVTVTAGALALVHYSGTTLAGSTGGAAGAGARPGPAGLRTAASPGTERAGSPPASPSAKRSAARLAAARAAAPAFFGTLPPGAALPSGAQCAGWVRARPTPENKGMNRAFNHTRGQRVGSGFFPPGDLPQAGRLLAPRINGDFTGTTSEILRWAACKWGINQNIVFAQAAVESWWNQTTLGDWGTDAAACPPGHGPGTQGKPGQCPQSYGILQNRYPFEQASWPGIADSTAMNADTAYAIWRSCYDGYETWLNNVPHGRPYRAGDVWGCVGRWFAGRWHTAPAQQYIAKVRQYLAERIWTTPDFQQPG